MSSDPRPGVLVVDDATLIRRLVVDLLEASGEFRVVGEAATGSEAIERCTALDPDLVTLDIEMPGMGGLEVLGYVMSESPRPVVVLSAASRRGEDLVVQALELGAVDFVRKPSLGSSLDVETLQPRLLQALRAARAGRIARPRVVPPRPWRRTPRAMAGAAETGGAVRRLVVIAASTGGPRALAELFAALALPAGCAAVVVQHMPAGFTTSLARRLGELGPHPVREAEHGAALCAGEVLVLGGGHDWSVHRDAEGVVRLQTSQHGGPIRPSADHFLDSAVATFGANVLGVILTGMGRDGARGAALVRARGGRVVVQAPDTSVIPGMPQAALDTAGADWCGPIDQMAMHVAVLCGSSPSRRA